MTKTNGLVFAAFLMASTAPMAIGQTTAPAGTEPTPLPGNSPTDITPAPMPQDTPAGTTPEPDTGADRQNIDYFVIIAQLSLPSAAGVDWEETFSDLSDDADVTIVTLSELADADDPSAPMLDQAMINLDNDRDNLRSAIETNDTLQTALEDEDFSSDDVVAALMDQTGDGSVTLVVDAEAGSDDDNADAQDDTEQDSDT
ncbi:MAG: hypothetical protein IKE14_05820 [Loktanella sp.]|nr:hypothetical protein [Loktanella sp.]